MSQEQKNNDKVRKTVLAAVGLCLGVALLLFGGLGGTAEVAPTENADASSAEQYRATVEATLASLCSEVSGAGKVSVFVTLSGGYEYVYAVDGRGACVTVGSGSSERAVVEVVRAPEVRGVGIVCEGASDPRVAQTLNDLVCAALGIGSNRVFITTGQ